MNDLITQTVLAVLDSFPLALIGKASIVFSAGAMIAFFLRGASSSVRHAVWALSFATALALPLGMIALPAWKLVVAEYAPVTPETNAPVVAVAAKPQPVSNAPDSETPSAVTVLAGTPQATTVFLLLWAVGAGALLLRMAAGRIAIRRISVRAKECDASALRELEREMARLDIRQSVRLLYSGEVVTPMTAGIFSPVVFLPESARNWSEGHRQVVIRHELAHVASGDAIVCLVAGITCAIYWFHPLAWMASRRLRAEQERACDDRVLGLGTPAAEYASHLLEVARTARSTGMDGFISMAMARPSQLEGRLLAVLNAHRSRGSISRRGAAGAATMSFVALIALSMVQPVIGKAAIVLSSQGSMATVALEPVVAVARSATGLLLDSTVTGEVPARSGGTLELDLTTGAAVTINTWDEPRVRMSARLSGRNWRQTEVALVPEAGGARITMRYRSTGGSQQSSHSIQVTVPRKFNVRLESAGGGITVTDTEGEITGSTGGGEIKIDRARGHAELRTGGGAIRVTRSHLSGTVSTGAGGVIVEDNDGGLNAYSGAGGVVRGPKAGDHVAASGGGFVRSSDGRVIINKAGGDVSIANAAGGASITTGGGKVTVGRSGGSVAISTGGGDVTVGPVTGDASASTGAGDVVITVNEGDTKDVDITSGSGRITLIVPRNLSATLDLETAYTNNRKAATRIVSDWPLAITETSDWDSTRGTPRRYVRVNQEIGGGGRKIRVRAINGDIVFRYKE